MVTHNANLVVNTDSDQVITTSSARTVPGMLPDITCASGGLEDAEVRAAVWSLLEGGEETFRRRGRRTESHSEDQVSASRTTWWT